MADEVTVWYDKEADFLEVLFERRPGYFQETQNDAIMEKVDEDGNVIGFSIMNVSSQSQSSPLLVSLRKRIG